MPRLTRRQFVAAVPSALGALGLSAQASGAAPEKPSAPGPRIGLVTYQLAQDWDVPTIIANCGEARFEAVELRTTHAHGVEVSLSQQQRIEVRKRFADSPVRLASLGSAFEYHSPDPAELARNIAGTKEFARLAADLGCDGIKVRPNSLLEDKGISAEKTTAQIAGALTEVGRDAAALGIEIRVEVHGHETNRVPVMQAIMEQCQSPNVYVCWNSNESDIEAGGLEMNFSRLASKIHFVHMRDLYVEEYPWRKLFSLLGGIGYTGYCCAEIPPSADPLRVMKYYRALFLAYQDRL